MAVSVSHQHAGFVFRVLELSSEHTRLKPCPRGSHILVVVGGGGGGGQWHILGRTANSSDLLGLFARVFQVVACS